MNTTRILVREVCVSLRQPCILCTDPPVFCILGAHRPKVVGRYASLDVRPADFELVCGLAGSVARLFWTERAWISRKLVFFALPPQICLQPRREVGPVRLRRRAVAAYNGPLLPLGAGGGMRLAEQAATRGRRGPHARWIAGLHHGIGTLECAVYA